MFNEVIYLIDYKQSVDEYGDLSTEKTERMVFAKLDSVTQSEFYQAQATGLRPEIKFTIADFLDYSAEKHLRYEPFNGESEFYQIIRTFRKNTSLELVCQKGID